MLRGHVDLGIELAAVPVENVEAEQRKTDRIDRDHGPREDQGVLVAVTAAVDRHVGHQHFDLGRVVAFRVERDTAKVAEQKRTVGGKHEKYEQERAVDPLVRVREHRAGADPRDDVVRNKHEHQDHDRPDRRKDHLVYVVDPRHEARCLRDAREVQRRKAEDRSELFVPAAGAVASRGVGSSDGGRRYAAGQRIVGKSSIITPTIW
mmetsp:Transcript_27910/g.83874  ORF Transcript_27910/g.83874 Transcript_27910/m.83874 type:complete len:206 (-) Transcript_27910:452-1069(-)